MAPTLYDEKPNPGDLIKIFRGSYQHWAVYVGDGFVVHLVPPSETAGAGSSSMMSVLADKAIVKLEKLLDVVGTHEWEINNSLDNEYEPRSGHKIVKKARELVGRELPYSIRGRNCEHFVNKLRYGKAVSLQVRQAEEAAMIAGAAAVASLGLGLAVAEVLSGGSKKEKRNTE